MSDSDLSATSEEEQLTAAEKARKTRARNLANEQAEAEKISAQIEKEGGRSAKRKALKNRVWDPSGVKPDAPEVNPSGGNRKRSASGTDLQPKTKKARAKQVDTDDVMDVDQNSDAVAPAASKKVEQSKTKKLSKPTAPGGEKQVPATRRSYVPTAIVDSSDESEVEHAQKPVKKFRPTLTQTTAKSSDVPAKPVKAQRKAKKPTTDDADTEDNGSQSDPEDEDDAVGSASAFGEDDTFPVDLLAEARYSSYLPEIYLSSVQCPRLIPSGDTSDNLLDFDAVDIPQVNHRRQSSLSSRGSIPPDTDHDFDAHDVDSDDAKKSVDLDDDDLSEGGKPPPAATNQRRRTSTAQQLKYDQEKPQIRASKVLHGPRAEAKPSLESDWHSSARLIFPTTGGQLKLLDQNPLLKAVIKDTIQLSLYEISFKNGYEAIPSRPAFVSRLVRLAAKKHPKANHIGRRAKKDMLFCGRLAPLICTRGGNLRSGLRNSAISKVATHYELNKPGTTSQIRSIIKQLNKDQHYIFPYTTPPVSRADADAPDNVEPAAAESSSKLPVSLKAFLSNLPFHAPAMVDMIREAWWSSPRGIGSIHRKHLKSNRADRPNEVVLPDAMICLAGANAWAGLQAWATGHYVPAPEFSQGRLESTYQSLLGILEDQRSGKSSKAFNGIMHDLYVKVSQSQSGVAPNASGSANNVISLDIDSD